MGYPHTGGGEACSEDGEMKRVVITGMGAVSPLGNSVAATWAAAEGGLSGVGPLTQSVLPGLIGAAVCEVKGFDAEDVLPRKEVRRQDRFQHLAIAAAAEAMQDAGLVIGDDERYRVGVLISSSSGGHQSFEHELEAIRERGGRACSPLAIAKIMPNAAAALVAMRYGAMGPSAAICTACASSADAIGHALILLRTGRCDVVIAGGTEASMHSVSLAGFERMGLFSKRTTGTPSPFCRLRDGFVLGEGAAILVLETAEHAEGRSARVYAELAGYGATTDAHHITSAREDGAGAAAAIREAMRDAGVSAEEVGYINAHGTGTALNDKMETRAIQSAFGEYSHTVPVSSTKSMTGHLIGAAGALELVLTVEAMRNSFIPPTINFLERDLECEIEVVANAGRPARFTTALSHSFGFGGHNSVLVVRAPEMQAGNEFPEWTGDGFIKSAG